MAKQFTVTLTRDKTTDNNYRYKNPAGDNAEDMVYAYLKKKAVRKIGNPERVKITVEAA